MLSEKKTRTTAQGGKPINLTILTNQINSLEAGQSQSYSITTKLSIITGLVWQTTEQIDIKRKTGGTYEVCLLTVDDISEDMIFEGSEEYTHAVEVLAVARFVLWV